MLLLLASPRASCRRRHVIARYDRAWCRLLPPHPRRSGRGSRNPTVGAEPPAQGPPAPRAGRTRAAKPAPVPTVNNSVEVVHPFLYTQFVPSVTHRSPLPAPERHHAALTLRVSQMIRCWPARGDGRLAAAGKRHLALAYPGCPQTTTAPPPPAPIRQLRTPGGQSFRVGQLPSRAPPRRCALRPHTLIMDDPHVARGDGEPGSPDSRSGRAQPGPGRRGRRCTDS